MIGLNVTGVRAATGFRANRQADERNVKQEESWRKFSSMIVDLMERLHGAVGKPIDGLCHKSRERSKLYLDDIIPWLIT